MLEFSNFVEGSFPRNDLRFISFPLRIDQSVGSVGFVPSGPNVSKKRV